MTGFILNFQNACCLALKKKSPVGGLRRKNMG